MNEIGSIGLEYGSWLYYGGRLGIYTKFWRPGTNGILVALEEIHFVNGNRETVEVQIFDPSVEYTYPRILTAEELGPHLAAIGE